MMKLSAILLAAVTACSAQPDPVPANSATPVTAVSPSGSAVGPAENRQSVFTTLDDKACSLIEQNVEEGGWWRRRCPGTAGYSVEWTESDLRQGLSLTDRDGNAFELPISATVAKGAFNRLGPRVEWRATGSSPPDIVVVRVFVATNSEPQAPDRSLLALARLKPPTCLIKIVEPGPNQSEEARRIADAPPGDCLP